MTKQHPKPIEILLVDDNEGDVFLTKEAFEKAKVSNNIHIAPDGEVAMNILRRSKEHAHVPLPDIVLLDISMPKKDGTQVLKEIKEDENLRRIPVIILTSSKTERDILKTYDLQASGYIVKPVDYIQFQEVVNAIENFWFSVVVLPSEVEDH